MPTLPPHAYPVFGASEGERTFPKRPCEERMAQDKFARRVFFTMEPSAPPAPKRARNGADVKIRESFAVGEVAVQGLPAPRHLNQRVQMSDHGKKAAVLFSRGTGRSGMATTGKGDDARIMAPNRRPEAPSAEVASKRRRTSPSKHEPGAAQQNAGQEKKKQYRVQRAAPTATHRSMANAIDKAKEVQKKRELEEIARAREKFRQELLEVEKAAIPDETIYPEELEELGITAFQYDVTRTRKQVQLGLR